MVTISIIALRSDSGDSARESEAEARPKLGRLSGMLPHGVINRLKPMRRPGETHSDAIKHTPRVWRRGLPAAPKTLDRLISCLIV
jgi:hypothetical protein